LVKATRLLARRAFFGVIIMHSEQWAAVDRHTTELLVTCDQSLEAALRANRFALALVTA
jgi:hypothetical protein